MKKKWHSSYDFWGIEKCCPILKSYWCLFFADLNKFHLNWIFWMLFCKVHVYFFLHHPLYEHTILWWQKCNAKEAETPLQIRPSYFTWTFIVPLLKLLTFSFLQSSFFQNLKFLSFSSKNSISHSMPQTCCGIAEGFF